ncbi:MAG: aminotransferase class IV [Pseudomonadota bacterium]
MTGIGKWAVIDGQVLASSDAAISPFDRGFLFGHAAYEVTAVYGGKLIDWPHHAERLARTLGGLEIPVPADIEALHRDLIRRNGLTEGLVYLQVTGGAYGFRDFAGPDVFTPGLFMFTSERSLIGDTARDGLTAITLPDERWKRRDWKTTQLLSQAQAYRAARKAGAETAWMHEDGLVTEAASANAWIVTPDGTLVTRNLSRALLSGITRQRVISLLNPAGIETEERAFTLEEARNAQEAFTTSTGAVIAPVLRLDGKPIGNGAPGPVTRTIQRLYYTHMGADLPAVAPWVLP